MSRSEIERVRDIPGPAFCNVPMICRWAGKLFVMDYAMGLAMATGKMTAEELQARMKAEGITRVAVDPRTVSRSLGRKIFSFMR